MAAPRRGSECAWWALGALVLVVACAAPAHAQARRVAVLDFTNSGRDAALEWLGPAVAETVTTKLHAIRGLQLVERLQLYKVLQEQKLNLTDIVDPSQAIQVGKLVGAEQVVLGGHSAFGGTVRFTARFVDTATGAIVATSQVNGILDAKNPASLWTAVDQLAQAVIDSLNTRVAVGGRIEPTPEEKARLAAVPTQSLEAQEVYGRGLAAYRKHEWADAAHEFGRATSLHPQFAQAWERLALVLIDLGRFPEALRAAERARDLSTSAGDQRGQAAALDYIGRVHSSQARYADALAAYGQGLRLAERLGDQVKQAEDLVGIGSVHSSQGRYADALSAYGRSLQIAERLGDEPLQARILVANGIVHAERGRFAEALGDFQRGLRLAERIGDVPRQATALNNMGAVHSSQRRYSEALTYFEQSLRLTERLGFEALQARALGNIGNLHQLQGRYADGLSYQEQALRLTVKLGDEEFQAATLGNIGSILLQQGRHADALSYYERSRALAEKLGDPAVEARALANMALTYSAQGRSADARSAIDRALAIADRIGMERTQLRQIRDSILRQGR